MTYPSDPRPSSHRMEPDQARQGAKTGRLRWVLSLGLALGVLAMGGVFVWYEAASHSRPAAAQSP